MESMKTSALRNTWVWPRRADCHAELRGLDATSVKVANLDQRGRNRLNWETRNSLGTYVRLYHNTRNRFSFSS